jgi:excisionase family DNA binding protein
MTVEDLAEYLGIPVQTVYKQRSMGTGPPGYPVGRWVRFKRSEVDAWLAKRKDDWG